MFPCRPVMAVPLRASQRCGNTRTCALVSQLAAYSGSISHSSVLDWDKDRIGCPALYLFPTAVTPRPITSKERRGGGW